MEDREAFKDVLIRDGYAFFLKGWLSNWHRSPFMHAYMGRARRFFCVEQAFMFAKASFFGDGQAMEKILNEKTASGCQKLGRTVRGYDEDAWEKTRYGVMLALLDEKFSQNRGLLRLLLRPEFDGLKFAEANPDDSVWSIGLSADDPGVCDESRWRGRNLLGKALGKIREWHTITGNLTVGDVVRRLQALDQNAFVVQAETHAHDYGFWQPARKDALGRLVRTIGDVKRFEKTFPDGSVSAGDYAYVDDNDVVLGF